MNKEIFKKIRRKIVVLKFTQARGYIWCQSIVMSIIAAGVLKPYLPQVRLYQLVLVAVFTFLGVGFIDRHFGFLTAEQSYGTEMNKLLMEGLRGRLK